MLTELIENEIARFLASPEPEAVCLRGKWGVGKTYTWNKFLVDAQKAKKIGLNKYSYVSLFGLDSLDQLLRELPAAAILDVEPKCIRDRNHRRSLFVNSDHRGAGTPCQHR